MYLITNKKEPFIAEKDLEVIKLMSSSIFGIFLFSYYLGSLWILGILKFAELVPKKLYIDYNTFPLINDNVYRIDSGLHAFLHLGVAYSRYYSTRYNNHSVVICKAIIPKGAKYYISEDGKEIVSNRMKITKILRKIRK